ncbi:MAG: porin family protein [Bacteroidia bacterium]
MLLVSVITATAQDNNNTDFRERLTFGLKAGANYSNVYDSQGESFHANPKIGLATGVFLAIPIGKYLGIQPEVLFSQKGFQATGRILNDTYNITRTTNYLDMPLLFAIKPSEFLTILAGPQFSYLLSQSDAFANASTSIAQEQEFENDKLRKNTLCLVGGVDLTLKHFVLGARAGIDVQSNNGNQSSTTPRYKNVWLQATVGYRFYRK